MPRTPPAGRGGFTLVELLVVMSLIIVLAGLTVAVAESGAFGSQKVISGADRASGWLLIAKQRAIRDQRPRGVRFLLTQPDPTGNPTLFAAREAQFIEVPDSWVPVVDRPLAQRPFLAYVYQTTGAYPPTYVTNGSGTNPFTTKSPANAQRVFVVFPNAATAVADKNEFDQRVFPGSLLTLPATGATFRVDQIFPGQSLTLYGQPAVGYELVLGQNTASQVPPGSPGAPQFAYPDLGATTSPPSAAIGPHPASAVEHNFAFTAGFSGGSAGTGGPQPLVGEPVLQLTGNTVIDVRGYPRSTGTSPVFNTSFLPTVGPGPGPVVEYPMTAGVTVSGSATTGFFFDVLFGPSGQVLGAGDGLICLWVRDPDKTPTPRYYPSPLPNPEQRSDAPVNTLGFDYAGEQKLVVVYTRTGLVATHEILPPPADPYTAARDGLNSGL